MLRSSAVCLGILMVFGMLLASCTKNRVAPDLVEYVNQGVLDISQLERNAIDAYSAVTGENYTSDRAVYQVLKETTIPSYRRFVDLLKQIDPATDEVRQVHTIYLQAANLMLEGFSLKMRGLEKGDRSLVLAGNEKIDAASRETLEWQHALQRLCEVRGVKKVAE